MKYLKSQDEVIFESLLNESIVYYSPELRDKLVYMSRSNVIAKDLVDVEGKDIKSDVTFIDFGPEGYFTFIQMDKAIKMIKAVFPKANDADLDINFSPSTSDILYRDDKVYDYDRRSTGVYKRSRNQIRVGKAINKLLSGKYKDSEIEEFVNIFKSTQILPGDISIVSGDAISKWYKTENYQSTIGSPLINSCMNDRDFLKLYTNNPDACKMLIATVDDKLVCRALLWKLSYSNIPGNPEYFMDRVYFIRDKDLAYIREYAKSRGWAYRANNNFSDTTTVEYNGSKYEDIEMEVKLTPARYKKYPYLDTFKRYIPESGTLCNDDSYKNPGIILSRTDGSYSETHYKPGFIQRIKSRFTREVPLIESINSESL